jgi:hypothetical protein
MYLGQAKQDKYVLKVLNEKRNGYFLEIGSNHPIHINNSYLLERRYGWKGIMVEYNASFLPLYKTHRPNSIHVINDATNVNYMELFQENNVPLNVDYLQIDLEANNGSTIRTLQALDTQVMDTYRFATVTFEHDIYHTNFENTRLASRDIFKRRGYVCVFEDIHHLGNPYEDWYVHPDLVDMSYVNYLIEINKDKYVTNNITGMMINCDDIQYV